MPSKEQVKKGIQAGVRAEGAVDPLAEPHLIIAVLEDKEEEPEDAHHPTEEHAKSL